MLAFSAFSGLSHKYNKLKYRHTERSEVSIFIRYFLQVWILHFVQNDYLWDSPLSIKALKHNGNP